jgi:hypothetical protein
MLKQKGEVMGVQGRQAEGHNLQVVLDQLHAGPVSNNKAPYWVVDQSANHDEDRQVMKGRKAAPSSRSTRIKSRRVSKDIHPIGKKNPNLPFRPGGKGRRSHLRLRGSSQGRTRQYLRGQYQRREAVIESKIERDAVAYKPKRSAS